MSVNKVVMGQSADSVPTTSTAKRVSSNNVRQTYMERAPSPRAPSPNTAGRAPGSPIGWSVSYPSKVNTPSPDDNIDNTDDGASAQNEAAVDDDKGNENDNEDAAATPIDDSVAHEQQQQQQQPEDVVAQAHEDHAEPAYVKPEPISSSPGSASGRGGGRGGPLRGHLAAIPQQQQQDLVRSASAPTLSGQTSSPMRPPRNTPRPATPSTPTRNGAAASGSASAATLSPSTQHVTGNSEGNVKVHAPKRIVTGEGANRGAGAGDGTIRGTDTMRRHLGLWRSAKNRLNEAVKSTRVSISHRLKSEETMDYAKDGEPRDDANELRGICYYLFSFSASLLYSLTTHIPVHH